jgi:signal peptidase I
MLAQQHRDQIAPSAKPPLSSPDFLHAIRKTMYFVVHGSFNYFTLPPVHSQMTHPIAENAAPLTTGKNRRPLLWLVLSLPALLLALRLLGLLIPYSIPTAGMSPAVSKGDMILVEGFTFLLRKPGRGDIIAFKTEGIERIARPPGVKSQIYLKRIAGLPGETLQISGGQVYVNGIPTPIRNQAGVIRFTHLQMSGSGWLSSPEETVTVPEGMYFVLGDNSPDSADSRAWGFVPAGNVLGKTAVRFGPLNRIGLIK